MFLFCTYPVNNFVTNEWNIISDMNKQKDSTLYWCKKWNKV